MTAPWSPTGVTTAEHDVVDRAGSSAGNAAQLVDQADDQRDRLDLVERPGRPCRARGGVRIAS
jgi:hypothetical protein